MWLVLFDVIITLYDVLLRLNHKAYHQLIDPYPFFRACLGLPPVNHMALEHKFKVEVTEESDVAEEEPVLKKLKTANNHINGNETHHNEKLSHVNGH